MSEMKERMLRGEPYRVDDELRADYARAQALLERFNPRRTQTRRAATRSCASSSGSSARA